MVKKTSGEKPQCDEPVCVVRADDMSIAMIMDVSKDDEPTAPGLVETPVATNTETRTESRERKTLTMPTVALETEGDASDVGKIEERQNLMREIDVAAALSKRIAETNPELTAVASFLNIVCGRANEPKKRQAEEVNWRRKTSEAESAILPSRPGRETEEGPLTMEVPHKVAVATSGTDRGGVDVESDSEYDEPEVVVLEDTESSGGESSGDESRSRSSFGGSSSSFCHSRVSRKRAAEDSPEREHGGALCQLFPGAISRGAGGCRVYVPTQTIVTSEETIGATPKRPRTRIRVRRSKHRAK